MVTHVRPSSATLTNGHFQDSMVTQKPPRTFATFATFATGVKPPRGCTKSALLPDCADEHATGTPERPARARHKAPSGRHVLVGSANGFSLVFRKPRRAVLNQLRSQRSIACRDRASLAVTLVQLWPSEASIETLEVSLKQTTPK